MKKPTLLLILVSFIASSCGVMFGGSKFSGSIIAAKHPDAKIFVDGKEIGKGAAIGLFPRRSPLTVELRQEGCPNHTETFNKAFRTGNFILSVFMWGWIGVGVDLGTGAAFKPGHRSNLAVERMNYKNFLFTVAYPDCN